jgi:hypothetical protein
MKKKFDGNLAPRDECHCDANIARYRDRDRGSDREIDYNSRHRNDVSNRDKDFHRNTDFQRSRDGDRDRDRDCVSDRGRQYTLTQRPSKQFNIELNKLVMRISDTRELCDFVLTHAAAFNHVNVATAFRHILKIWGESLPNHRRRYYKHWRSLLCKTSTILEPNKLPRLYTLWPSMGTKQQVPSCSRWSGGRRRYQGSSTSRLLQTRCGRLRRWRQSRGSG